MFEHKKDCIVYYGFDASESDRITRRSSIMGAMGYKTAFPIAFEDLEIKSTVEIGISKPSTYKIWKHANCVGCLKAGLLHWYVVYCLHPDIYKEAHEMEQEIDFTIHTVTRKKQVVNITLEELAPIYEALKMAGVPATEYQSAGKFGRKLALFQLTECNVNKPCECSS